MICAARGRGACGEGKNMTIDLSTGCAIIKTWRIVKLSATLSLTIRLINKKELAFTLTLNITLLYNFSSPLLAIPDICYNILIELRLMAHK